MPMNPRLMRPLTRIQAPAPPRTLYFNGAVDNDWATLGNWWNDDEFASPALSLPASADSVVVLAGVYPSGTPLAVSLAALTVSSNDEVFGEYSVSGPVVFGGSSTNFSTITGNTTFNDGSVNDGTVNGDATFNDGSLNWNTVTGDATFNYNSANDGGTVNGDATFNDGSLNWSAVTGDATFNDDAYNYGTVNGNATFNDDSSNYGLVDDAITCNTTGQCVPQ